MFFFDPMYFLYVGPFLLLGLYAQLKVKSTYQKASRMPAPLSGAAAARYILDSSGATNVTIEITEGHLTDHYDPRGKVLRLSEQIYHTCSLAAVGIAAHEAGHAIQDARNYMPLVVRNAAVPAAKLGPSVGIWMLIIGFFLKLPLLLMLGIGLFSAFVAFQIINLPVEFNASTRARRELVALGIIDSDQAMVVKQVLDAAAWTYVAATLQAIATLLYYVTRFQDSR